MIKTQNPEYYKISGIPILFLLFNTYSIFCVRLQIIYTTQATS